MKRFNPLSKFFKKIGKCTTNLETIEAKTLRVLRLLLNWNMYLIDYK